ncbi:Putative ribonuclease H protein At1g65750 [Linum perenne]
MHLVSWDQVCKPKSKGGLGLRLARHLNMAFMAKLAFRFVQNPDELWAKVLHSKYFREVGGSLRPRNAKSQSRQWRDIDKAWGFMLEGARFGIGNDRDTKFWSDRWLDSGVKLIDQVINLVVPLNLEDLVCDFVNANGDWDLAEMSVHLDEEALKEIRGMLPPSENRGDDSWIWGLESNGKFSIRSDPILPAYKPQTRDYLGYGVEMDQTEQSSVLPVVWDSLGFSPTDDIRLGNRVDQWLRLVMKHERETEIGILIWYLWKARNDRIFNGIEDSPSAVASKVSSWSGTVRGAFIGAGQDGNHNSSRRRADTAWVPGAPGWVILNSDGSVQPHSGYAAVGGLL